MSVDFDTYRDRYREAVDESIAFVGQDVEFFARVKAVRLLDLVRRRLGDPRRLTFLDIGCGVGVTDQFIQPAAGRLVGVDIAPGVIEQARRANPDGEYRVYDGSRLPCEDGSVDVAFAICVVHHVPPSDWPAFHREMARVVRPGGLAVVFEHNPRNPLTLRVVRGCEFDEDAVLLRRRAEADLMRQAGLRVVEDRFIGFFPFGARTLAPVERALGRLPLGAQYYVAAERGTADGGGR